MLDGQDPISLQKSICALKVIVMKVHSSRDFLKVTLSERSDFMICVTAVPACKRRTVKAHTGMAWSQRFLNNSQYIQPPRLFSKGCIFNCSRKRTATS